MLFDEDAGLKWIRSKNKHCRILVRAFCEL